MAIVQPDDPRLVFIKLRELSNPSRGGFYQLYKNYWWTVHPEKGLVFWKSSPKDSLAPQCNFNEHISEDISQRMYPWAEVHQVENVFVPIDPREWRE